MVWQDYEEIVKVIYENIGRIQGAKIECWGASCRRIGVSGTPFQIDVLTSHTDGLHTYYTAIECKHWKSKVDKDPVIKLAEAVRDCKLNQGVVISKEGFTDDAVTWAKSNNIHLIQLKENNWHFGENQATKLYMNIEVATPHFLEAKMRVSAQNADKFQTMFKGVNAWETYLVTRDNIKLQVKQIINDTLNSKLSLQDPLKMINEIIHYPDSTLYHEKANISCPINGLEIIGFITHFTKLAYDYLENKVWLLMKIIFEQKEYGVTFDGMLLEVKRESIHLTCGLKSTIAPVLRKKEFAYELKQLKG